MPKPLAVVPDLDAELDELYAQPPSEFTQARNDLARRLKQAGQGDAAAEVAKLRKPTAPVWAVNQLARQHADELAALLQSSDRLREAQRAALGGEETDSLRAATAAQRDALQKLTHLAHERLSAQGISPTAAMIERVASTLRTGALDPSARDWLQSGRLHEELDPSGFEALAGMPFPPRVRRATGSQKGERAGDRRRRERLQKLREQLEQAEAAAERAEEETRRASAEATRKRADADRARAKLEAAESPPE